MIVAHCDNCGKVQKQTSVRDFESLVRELNNSRKKIMSLASVVERRIPEARNASKKIREAASKVDSAEKLLWSANYDIPTE